MDAGKEKRFWVGIDWATQEHRVCVINDVGDVVAEKAIAHSGDGLQSLCDWLIGIAEKRFESVRVAIEVPHGAVVETLLERGFAVYAINPKQLDRFRDRFSMAGAKDDRRDARVLADSLRTDERCYRKVKNDEAVIVELREWSRMLDELKTEANRLSNRMREQLRRYFPQMLELDVDVDADWFIALWMLAPTPAKAAAVRPSKVTKVLKDHRVRKYTADEVLAVLRRTPLVVAPGTEAAATVHVTSLIERLRVVNAQLHRAEQRLDALLETLCEAEDVEGQKCEHRDAEILRSLPGVGRIVLATMLAEGSQLLAERDYHALRSITGVAPVTKASGKSRIVVMRRACNPRLRNAVHHWANSASQHDPKSRARCAAQKAKGKSHGQALRSVGDRLLGIACAMLRDRTLFRGSDPPPRVDQPAAA